MYRVNQVKLGVFEEESILPDKILKKIAKDTHISPKGLNIQSYEIVKESLDARKKNDIKRVFTVNVEINRKVDLKEVSEYKYDQIYAKNKPNNPPIVVGFGPAGMFAALILAIGGLCPIVIDRGSSIEKRSQKVDIYWKDGTLDENSNVQYGEGGAGTFSDGKLTTGISDPRIRKVLNEFVEAGAPKDILIKQKPHLGTDRLRHIVPKIREKIIDLGGKVIFDKKVIDIILDERERNVLGLLLSDGSEINSDNVVMAIGHSARDTFKMMSARGMMMSQKPFSMGVRIEHPQSMINKAQYGDNWEAVSNVVGPAEYKLSHHLDDGKGVYTFCMCPGGEIVMASTEADGIVTNGMSSSARDGEFGNSAILVDVDPKDYKSPDLFWGANFQRRYEKLAFELGKGKAPFCERGKYIESDLYQALPHYCSQGINLGIENFGKKLSGFDSPNARLVGVETRSSSPVKIFRNSEFESNIGGLYPSGEGAGYAGGITSSAVDGIRVAEAILKKHQ